jgi:N-methylhydantoinase B
MRLDPVQVEILNNHFAAIANEMGYIIWRTAFTAYVKETWDFAQGLATTDGEIFAFSKDIGGAPFLGLPLGDFLKSLNFEEGDIVLCNDPYSTGGMCTHLPDLHLVKPFFYRGELICFLWDFIHAADVGGIVPGSAPPSTYDIFQEGVRIPPSKLFKSGRMDEEIRNFVLANTRVPHEMWGDIKALIAALHSAERRLIALADRYGVETLRRAIADVLDYGEERARAVLAGIPDGAYSFVDYIEGYPGDGMPYRIELRLELKGSEVLMDFTGTDLEMPSSYNIATDGKTHHFLTFGLVSYIRSRDPTCPLNSGVVRPVTVRVPKGTLLNPHPGASCSVRYVTAERVLDIVMGALAQAGVPLIPAAGGGCVAPIMYSVSEPRSGRYKLGILQMLLGGMGGRPGRDGVHGVDFSNAFFRNGPNETAEAELPVVVRRYGLDDRGAAAGEWRGGLGVVYEVESLAVEAVMTARCMERERFRPWGRAGGEAGTRVAATLNPGRANERELGKIDALHLKRGDVVRIRMPSGGGFGEARAREPSAVAQDLRDGIITVGDAEEAFGVVLKDGRIDENASAGRRRGRKGDQAPFSYGPERRRYEQIFPQALQRLAVEGLLCHPTAIARHLRDRLWEEIVSPALERGTPIAEESVRAFLDAAGTASDRTMSEAS